MKTQLHYIKFLAVLFLLLAATIHSKAQTTNDGAMYLEYYTSYYYVESVDDPTTGELNANEYRWIFWGADNADLDGLGWRGGATIGINSSNYGWVGSGLNLLMSQQYGTAGSTAQAVPTYLQLRGEGWEDDCYDCFRSTGTISYECDQCSSNIYDGGCGCSTNILCGCSAEDQHCGPNTISSTIPFRVVPPCSAISITGPSWIGDYGSSTCGNDDIAAELLVYWTPPRPNSFTASTTSFCNGGGTTTLNLSGAVFGGTYDIYDESTSSFIATNYSGTTYTLFVGSTKTFRLYTRNNGCRSQSWFPLTITVAAPLSAGTISASQTVCNGGDPAVFTNTASASGGLGGFTYQWESQANCTGGFGNVGGATSSTYDVPAGITQTTCYRRTATNTCGSVSTGALSVTVLPTINYGTVSGGGGTYCATADPGIMSVTPSGGTGTFAYQWYYQNGSVACPTGSSTAGWIAIGSANSSTYDPPAGLTTTRTYAVLVDPSGSPDCGGGIWAGNCVTVTVNSLSVAPTSITGVNTLCPLGSTTLSVNGGALGTGAQWVWYSGSCGGTLVGTGNSITVSPASTTTYYVRAEGTCNNTTCASSTVTVNTNSTAPGSVGGTSNICLGQSTMLSVNGGSLGSGAQWYWYTGGCGTTLVGSGATLTVTPTTSTTYYVRAEGTCNTTTCASLGVTVSDTSLPATSINANQTVFCNGDSATLSIVGGSLGAGASWKWYSGSCAGTPVGTGSSIVIHPTVNTTYYVRAEGTCNNTICRQISITVNTLSAAPSSIAGVTTVCEGTSTTLTAQGGSVGTGAVYTWYSGTCGGTPVGTGISVTVFPTVTTNYFVRLEGTCNTTSCVSTTVTVNDTSKPATSISGSPAICINSSTLLNVVGGHLGVGAIWHWYVGSCGGTSIGGGSSLSVSPTVTTTYYVRAEGLCNTTICIPFTVNVNPLPNGNISGSTTVCSGTDTVIIFNLTTGTGPFDILYTDGTNVYNRNGVSNGDTAHIYATSTATYTYTQITDANGCIRSSGFLGGATITVAPLPSISNVSVSNVFCNGGNTGSISVTASGGTPGYVYSDDAGATYQSGNVFASLTAGAYNLYVKDILNCTSAYTFNPVNVTEPAVLDHTNTVTDASCANVFDGSIVVNATGGTIPYSYSLNGGPAQMGNTFSGLAGGSYTVQVTDAHGCTDTSHVLINNSYGVTAVVDTQTNVSCFGGTDGTVTVHLTGGIPPYSYSINGVTFQSAQTFTGLAAGNYTVTMRDSKGCADFASITIIQPNILQAIVDSVHQILCNGTPSGAIYISVTGGNAPYSFLWSNGATTEDVTNLGAGIYNVTITDSKGCSTSAGVTITQPLQLFVNVASYHNLSCYNDSTGSIDITANGGTAPYWFVWSTGDTTEDIYGLHAGTYLVTVSDVYNCRQVASQTITEPTQLTTAITGTNVSCNGAANGTVTLTVNGGTMPYNYLWNNGFTTQNLTNIAGGNYSVVVHDANGCSTTDVYAITEPAAIALSASVTNVLCNGALTGAIDLTVTGGTGTYTYAWSNSATTEDISGLAAGNYTITVTDINSTACTAVATYTVAQPAGLILNATPVNVACAGGANGAVDITVNGGVFPYTYLWSNTATTEDIHNVSGGTYSVTVTDANGCTISNSYTITEPTAITSSIIGTDVSCNGASDGAADLTVNGGAAPYSFLWSTFQGSEDVTGLSGGLFYVVIHDANGCEHKDSVLINEPAPLVLSTNISNISCYNSNDGAIDLTVTGGTPTYTYAWSNGAVTEDLQNLQNGVYVVTVTDAHTCSSTTSISIINPSVITANFIVHNPLCFGSADGSIDMIPSGGTPPFTYLWSNGATTEDIANIVGGTYIVTLTDTKGCARIDSAKTIEPQPLVTSGFITNVTCAGAQNGFIDITAYGGTLPYYYHWSSGESTEDIGGKSGGNYFVTVTDANGCQASTLYPVLEPLPLTVDVVGSNVSCYGLNNANVAAVPTGGTTPYYYLWNTFDTDSSLTGMGVGKYTVQVIDSNGCFTYDSLTITQPTAIVVTGTVTNALCFGATTGAVDITVNGGSPAYTFAWSNGDVTEDLSNVSAGTYTVTVTDANGCSTTAMFTITEGTEIIAGIGTYNPVCSGGNSGGLTAIVSGGVGPYTYQWSTTPVQTSLSANNLIAGTYFVTVTDSKGCTVTNTATLTDPPPIVVLANPTGAKCFNTASGAVATTVSGGFPPYTYLLNGVGQANGNFNGLLPGNYIVVVTDANGCQGQAPFTVNSPSQLSVSLGVTQQVILTGMQTQLVATAQSDTTIIHYIWSPDSLVDLSGCTDPTNCPNPYAFPRTTTTFTVYAVNADSCVVSDTVTVTVINQPSAFMPSAFTPNGDGLNDRFEVDILGATDIEVMIFNRWGQRVYYNASQTNGLTGTDGWDGTVNGKPAPEDTYVYQIKVVYYDTISKDFTGTITLMK